MSPRNGHKYGAVRTTVDSITFASKAEAKRYGELKLLEKAGEIIGLKVQPEFSLNAWSADHADCPKVGVYRADFEYVIPGYRPITDQRVIEDVKGVKTALYRWKKKHFEAQYGITITEITR